MIQSKETERGAVICQLGKYSDICRVAVFKARLKKPGNHHSNIEVVQMLMAILIAV